MRDDKRITQEDIDKAEVRLPPLFGLEPGKWLAALLALAFCALLFVVLVLPGIIHNGSVLHFDSRPRGAAVRVDGVYVGSTPCEVFVPSGEHSITIERVGFSPFAEMRRVGGRLFASLIVPRREQCEPRLTPLDAEATVAAAYREYARWALTGKPAATYQTPLVLSESLLALTEAGRGEAFPRAAAAALAARAFAAAPGEHAARDALRASFLAAAGGAPSPLGFVAGLEALAAAEGANPAILPYLEAILPQAARERLAASDGYTAVKAAALARANAETTAAQTAAANSPTLVNGVAFRQVPAGTVVLRGAMPDGTEVPYAAKLGPAFLAVTETSRGEWARFLAANPAWRPENRATLVAEGRASDDYLADWGDGTLDAHTPVTHVSWHAAQAYCEWLSGFAPAGWTVVLPTEALWERVASLGGAFSQEGLVRARLYTRGNAGPAPVGAGGFDRLGFADLAGNLWEWCADDYLAAPALVAAVARESAYRVPEKTLRGGSFANVRESVALASRGGFEPSASSAFLGFRPALVPRDAAAGTQGYRP